MALFRVGAIILVLFVTTLGALWFLDMFPPETLERWLIQGGSVLALLTAGGAVVSWITRGKKGPA